MSSSDIRYPKEVLREIEEWLRDPFNESFMFQRTLDKLQNFSLGQEENIGEVLVSLTSLSHWYASKGIVEIFSGELTGRLCVSFWYDFFYNTIMKSSFEKAKSQKTGSFLGAVLGLRHLQQPKPRIQFSDQGLLLAKAFALGPGS